MSDLNVSVPILTSSNQAYEKQIVSRINSRIIPLVFLSWLNLFLIRFNLGFVSTDFCQSLHLTYAEYGIGASLFFLTYSFLIIPGGMFFGKMKINIAFFIMLFANGIISILLALSHNKYHYYVLRFLMGAFQAGMAPTTYNYINEMYPKKELVFAYAVFSASGQFSMPLLALIAFGMLSLDGIFFKLEGWRLLFILEGLICCLFSVFVYFNLPVNIENCRFLSSTEKSWLRGEIEKNPDDTEENHSKNGFWQNTFTIFKIKYFWFIAISSLFRSCVNSSTNYFVTFIISEMLSIMGNASTPLVNNQEQQLTSNEDDTCANETSDSNMASILTAVPYISAGLGCLALAKYNKLIPNNSIFLFIAYLIASLCFLVWIVVQKYLIIGMLMLVISVTLVSSIFSLFYALLDDIFTKDNKIVGISWFSYIIQMGAFVNPAVAGVIIDVYDFNGCAIYLAVLMLLAAIFILFSYQRKN